ncbi:MAG TPA: tRNA (5-methylaminomethyl-2-thiouridine)(34)-methyltransferase MnmD [Pirellulaceae bacterium]|nr:tRNA (5-methylaminomethyl-2-thiouridine)(34)-methyltransferase MnmD [Pirellulaceae bacterium]HMO91021.1 tRNA (5-methylaminomethyl-2-thiouridine)(34)-methyltransferase MnmD [Pirellulaceae bacterium]HMP68136.1 tRNA (5-methylaminomethyl-2-thiouridine)(34)-methyltransferase MnmD [Pirellulaceae bacterium]
MIKTDDGSWTLYSCSDKEAFHSESGAVAESRLVFVQNSGIQKTVTEKERVRVLEIGYGTGLNFLLTVATAVESQGSIDYVAFDNLLLNSNLLHQLQYDHWLPSELAAFYQAWMEWHNRVSIWHASVDTDTEPAKQFTFDYAMASKSAIALSLCIADVTKIDFRSFPKFDAIYLDAFSPQTTPQLWSPQMLQQWSDCLTIGGRLVTYCVKAEIQHRLSNAGLTVCKTPGPIGGKREVLIAEKVAIR